MYVRRSIRDIHAYMHTCIHTYIITYIPTYPHTYLTHIHAYVDMHTCMHACIHTYMLTYTRAIYHEEQVGAAPVSVPPPESIEERANPACRTLMHEPKAVLPRLCPARLGQLGCARLHFRRATAAPSLQ